VWPYWKLKHSSSAERSYHGKNIREELVIRRDRQEMMLSVLDKGDMLAQDFKTENTQNTSYLTVLQLSYGDGRRPCLVLQPNGTNVFKRSFRPVILTAVNTRRLPEPRLIQVLSSEEVKPQRLNSLEFRSNIFRIVSRPGIHGLWWPLGGEKECRMF
jgi:hypothetical protein